MKILGHGNPGRDMNKHLDPREEKRLRGSKITQIKKDLEKFDGTDKEKVLAYSQHLNWCLKVFEAVYKVQSMAAAPGVWDQSGYTHGYANGVITVMAIMMEEQGSVPYIKAPEKYKKSDTEQVHEAIEEYLHRLESLISKVILMDENGPQDYKEEENPILAWIYDTLDVMIDSPVQSERLKGLRKSVKKQIEKRINQK